jgi:type II secretory pathway pseudopilin PulG
MTELSTGAKAGIIVVAVLLLIGAVILVVIIRRRKREQEQREQQREQQRIQDEFFETWNKEGAQQRTEGPLPLNMDMNMVVAADDESDDDDWEAEKNLDELDAALDASRGPSRLSSRQLDLAAEKESFASSVSAAARESAAAQTPYYQSHDGVHIDGEDGRVEARVVNGANTASSTALDGNMRNWDARARELAGRGKNNRTTWVEPDCYLNN